MSKLPIISGMQVVKIFTKVGYEIDHQTGSHVILRNKDLYFYIAPCKPPKSLM